MEIELKKPVDPQSLSTDFRMVALLTIGLAQKAILRIYASGRYSRTMPNCNPIISFSLPIKREKIAPPAIAVQRIPAKEP